MPDNIIEPPVVEQPEPVAPVPPRPMGGDLVDDPRKTNIFVLIGISLVVVAAIVGIYLFFTNSMRNPKPADIETPEEVVEVMEEETSDSPFAVIPEKKTEEVEVKKLSASIGESVTPETTLKRYLSANSGNNDIFSDLLLEGETFEKTVYSNETNSIAFITRIEGEPQKHRVILYKIDSGDTVNLFEQEIVPIPFLNDENRVYMVRDLAFSENGKFLSFVTNYKVLVYDVAANHLTEYLDSESIAQEQNDSFFFSYFAPMLNKDASKIVFGKSYYEGSGSTAIDIAKQEIYGLPFYTYASGEYVLGWVEEKLLVQRHGSTDDAVLNGLFLTTLSDPEVEEYIYVSSNMPFEKAVVTDDAIYTFFGVLNRYDRNTRESVQVMDVAALWPEYIDGTNRFWEIFEDYEGTLYLKYLENEKFVVYRVDMDESTATLHKMLLD